MGDLAAGNGFVMRDLDRSAADLAVAAAERQKDAIVFVYFDGRRRARKMTLLEMAVWATFLFRL